MKIGIFRKIGGHIPRTLLLDSHIYGFGPDHFNARQGLRINQSGQVVPLTPRSIERRHAFMESGGRVLVKDELLERVWKGVFIEEGTLHRHHIILRQALRSEEDDSQSRETVPKCGYCFIGSIREIKSPDVKPACAPERMREKQE